jgi:hypothetical protein
MIYQLTSIKTIIAKVVRDLDLMDQEVPWEDMIEWIAEGLKHIGSYYQFTEKAADIDIEDYKGVLPCDFYKSIRILQGTYNEYHNNHESLITKETDGDKLQTEIEGIKFSNYDFNITHNVITVSYRTGTIKLQYLAMPVDSDGFPLVPDDVSYSDALFWKVAYHLCLRGHEFKRKELNNLQFVKNKWGFYCTQARANANMPDGDMYERLKNNWLRLKTDKDQYRKLFSGNGQSEFLNLSGKD